MGNSQSQTASEPDVLANLRAMDPYTFEKLVADVWEAQGYTAAVSQASNDMGVDVIAESGRPENERDVIQVKRYSATNTVGGPKVQQYASLRRQEDADNVVIVSTGYFTDQAHELAEQLDVALMNGVTLCRVIADLEDGAGDELIQHYLGENVSAPSQRRWGTKRAPPSLLGRIAGGVAGSVYLLSLTVYILAAGGVRLPPGVAETFRIAQSAPNPGVVLLFSSMGAITLLLLWTPQWRWKAGGGLIIGGIGMFIWGTTLEPWPWWIDPLAVVLMLLPAVLAAMFSVAAHQRAYRGGRALSRRGLSMFRAWRQERRSGESEDTATEQDASQPNTGGQ